MNDASTSGPRPTPETLSPPLNSAGAQRDDRIAVRNFFELLAWLVAASGGLYSLNDTLMGHYHELVPGMHPLSFLFFALAFFALNAREFTLFPATLRRLEPQLSRALPILLALFVVLRLAESAWGRPFAALTFIGGDAFGATAYASWGTALGILFLFSMATFFPKPALKALSTLSYLLFCSLVLFSLHTLLHWTGLAQSGLLLPGLSGGSAFALLCLALVVLPRSAVWDVLFDARTRRSNVVSVGVITLAFGITFWEAALLQHAEVAELFALGLLLSLRVLAPRLRARELKALAAAGRLTPEGALIQPPRLTTMRPLPQVDRKGLQKLVYDISFVKPLWVQDALSAVFVFGVSVAMIALSRSGDSSVATFWPVNAIVGYWLLLNPVARWPRVVGYAYAALLSANILMDNPLAASAMLTAVNAIEAVMVILVARAALGMFVQDRLVYVTRLDVGALLTGCGLGALVLLISSVLGGGMIEHFFGGALLANSWTWFNGSMLGWFTIMPIALGLLMEEHWGYPRLKAALRPAWLILPLTCAVYWAGLTYLAAPDNGVLMFGFALLSFSGLGYGALSQAGVQFLGLMTVRTFWSHQNSEIVTVSPAMVLAAVVLVSVHMMTAFLIRKTQARTERERDLIARDGPSNVVTLDSQGRIVSTTHGLAEMTGMPIEQLIGSNLLDVLHVEHPADAKRSLPALGKERWRFSKPKSATRAVDIVTQNVSDRTMPFTYICAVVDQTEVLEADEARISLVSGSKALIIAQDVDWKIAYCSDGWCKTMGYTRDETVGKDLLDFFSLDSQRALNYQKRGKTPSLAVLRDLIDEGGHFELRTKAGDSRIVGFRSVSEGVFPAVIISSLDDVTNEMAERAEKERAYAKLQEQTDELRQSLTALVSAQRQLTALVERDELTGLLSRRGLRARFEERRTRGGALGLFVIDIDHFKSVNDTYGHDGGDALLKAIATTLTRLAGEDGAAVRLGGEEFVLLVPWAGWQEAKAFGEELRAALSKTSIEHNGRQVSRTASIGVTYFAEADGLSQAMTLGDLVQREAKQTGRNKVVAADAGTIARLEARGQFITNEQVQAALEAGEFLFYVQPIWNVKDEVIEGFEALIRWQRPDGTMVMPGQFMHVLKEVVRDEKYRDIQAQLREVTVAKLSAFPKAYVSFNYSLEQLAFVGAARAVHAELSLALDSDDRQLVVELSEAAINGRVDQSVLKEELKALKDCGYLIALDDFGVEASNFQRLQDFPIDIVKLDRSMLAGIETDERRRRTLSALAIMLNNLNINVIVEGVETARQGRMLEINRLNLQQGYLHAKPMRPEEVIDRLDAIGANLSVVDRLTTEMVNVMMRRHSGLLDGSREEIAQSTQDVDGRDTTGQRRPRRGHDETND